MRFKFLTVLTVMCLLLGITGTVFAQKRKLRADLKAAKEKLEFEEYANAIPHIAALIKEDSKNAYYNFWMGKCLYKTYRKNQALPYFVTVEQVNPDVDEEFHYYYALTLHYNLQYDKAIEEYRRDMERYAPDRSEYQMVNARISQCLYAKRAGKVKDNNLVKISNMGESINSEFAEHSPVISADNSTLIYTARRPDSRGAELTTGFYDEDIYVSKQVDSVWGPSANIGLPVNSKGHDATISLTADGKTLFLYRHKRDGGLYRTDFDNTSNLWKEPRAIDKPLNSKYYEASICQSADSSLMFFTSNRPGGYGGLDIYMSQRKGKDDWTEPKNLGAKINTASNEDSPFFHPDGRTLYFSSDGPNGYGGYDIFVTEFDSASGEFLMPLNMGQPINSADDEIYFVLSSDGLHGYYSSGKEGGYGEKDIYEIGFPYPRYPKRYYAIEVVGIVQDSKTMDTLSGTVRLVDKTAGMVIDSMPTGNAVGKYYFNLEPSRSYSLEVDVDGYAPVRDGFWAPEYAISDIKLERNLFANRPELAASVPAPPTRDVPAIQHIYFDFDKSSLRDAAQQELEIAMHVLEKNPDLKLEIVGHTDWYNNFDYNQALSKRRAHAASDYLRARGLDPGRILETPESEVKPLDPNDDDRGRQYNRRCELRFVDANGKVAFASVRLRPGSDEPEVDHTRPKGQPGLDYPSSPESGKPEEEHVVSNSLPNATNSNENGSLADAFAANISDNSATSNATEALDLHHIYFDFDKAMIGDKADAELQKIAALLQSHPNYHLEIRGHTDAFGNIDYNQRLSEKRCAESFERLSGLGIPVSRMSFKGFSESIPLADNESDRGRQANRRVEFVILNGDQVVASSRP